MLTWAVAVVEAVATLPMQAKEEIVIDAGGASTRASPATIGETSERGRNRRQRRPNAQNVAGGAHLCGVIVRVYAWSAAGR